MRAMPWNSIAESAVNGLAKQIALKAASAMRMGQMQVEFPDGSASTFGKSGMGPSAHLRILDEKFFSRTLLKGEIGFCEGYVEGLWTSDNLPDLFYLAILNRRHLNLNLNWLSWLSRMRNRKLHLGNRNTQSGSKENVRAHYDLSNDFFKLFLDETMTYSCGVFPTEGSPLAEAQHNKYRMMCEKIGISSDDSVLEIGTGWGGFAVYAAKRYGCKVTSITISKEQYDLAKERVDEEGLSSLIDIQLCDYRDVTDRFDKIVSIEMFEAVGAEYFETFFGKCNEALRPGGRMCMQVITIPHRSFQAHQSGANWLQKYIFPGGVLPSVAAMEEAVASTSLLVSHVEEIGSHYIRTLATWRDRFLANLPAVRDLGFDERFIRIWDCYLASCQSAFRARSIGDVQIVFDKPLL